MQLSSIDDTGKLNSELEKLSITKSKNLRKR